MRQKSALEIDLCDIALNENALYLSIMVYGENKPESSVVDEQCFSQ